MKLEELPSYLHCEDCPNPHFLSLNRDAHGHWSIGYVEFEHGAAIEGLALNGCNTIKEATIRMNHAIMRRNKRRGNTPPARNR